VSCSEPIRIEIDSQVGRSRFHSLLALLSDYWALTKPEVNFLILITTFAGFYLGCASKGQPFSFLALFNTLLGTLLVASGTGTLNQYIERRFDARMRRTARRPLAAGRLRPQPVLGFGIGLATIGIIYLSVVVNALASLLALLTLLFYLCLYTPLKRRTHMCVVVGAFPGAVPPLIGWAAASGQLNGQAWILYAILFLWQFPHFMSIAWIYRDDYDRADYQVLPTGKARVPVVILETLLPLLALVPITLVQVPTHHAAAFYYTGSLLGSALLYLGIRFAHQRSRKAARRLLTASIIYLPLLFLLSATLCSGTRR
jgi:heme o synthase